MKFTATNGATIPGTATTDAGGKASVTLTSKTAGISVVTASVGSSTQSVNSTFIAHAGSAEIGNGALVMITDNEPADGASQNVVQATITDANGNLVPNQVVTFSVESGAATLTGTTATTNASGVASMTLTCTQGGTSTLRASINGSERTVNTTFLAMIDVFIKPSTPMMIWADADAHCKANGARLPTANELHALWEQATVGRPSNNEMCSVHGWPLLHQCGGTNNGYWARAPSAPGTHELVLLNNNELFNVRDSLDYNVACVR